MYPCSNMNSFWRNREVKFKLHAGPLQRGAA
jgi:hypothetical protein